MNASPDSIGDLLRRFYAVYGMPGEGPPPGFDVTQIVGGESMPEKDRDVLVKAMGDQALVRQFTMCRQVLENLATRLTTDELMRELSSIASHSDQEFDEMLGGVLWFSLASSLDQRRDGIPATPFDEHFQIPLPVKIKLTVEGSLVLRLYVSLVYMREGVLSSRIAHGARSGKPCCGRVSKLLNSDYVRRIRNALSHGSFSSCVAGITFRDDNGVIVATPGFLSWLCMWLMLIQLQGLSAVSREKNVAQPDGPANGSQPLRSD
ncbi:MAG: hypothetical protein HZA88_06840 [Verrucomicrobia bacterium]|nr:hypothetical protein [Verrucomicrobiota bacterium]